MTKLAVTAALGAFAAFAWLMLPAPSGPAADPRALSDGVVLAVDRAAGSVTLRHGPLVNVGMPAMTMEFRVGARALLDNVNPGDPVKFQVDAVAGAFTVTRIERATQ